MTLRDAAIVAGGLGGGLVPGSIANDAFGTVGATLVVSFVILVAALLLVRRPRE